MTAFWRRAASSMPSPFWKPHQGRMVTVRPFRSILSGFWIGTCVAAVLVVVVVFPPWFPALFFVVAAFDAWVITLPLASVWVDSCVSPVPSLPDAPAAVLTTLSVPGRAGAEDSASVRPPHPDAAPTINRADNNRLTTRYCFFMCCLLLSYLSTAVRRFLQVAAAATKAMVATVAAGHAAGTPVSTLSPPDPSPPETSGSSGSSSSSIR